MKKSKNRAFTLAEVMIVLTVIGILSAILLPVAWHSTPDKNVLKFKKFHNNFASVIRELVSSGEYYLAGDLSKKPDGIVVPADTTTAAERNYFINSLSDIMSYKEVTYTAYSDDSIASVSLNYLNNNIYSDKVILIESFCQIHSDKGTGYDIFNRLVTSEGIYIWEYAPMVKYRTLLDSNGFDNFYKIICVDIDGPNGSTRNFGYGIRKDGKIIYGPRVTWWLERDITKKESDCCPKYVSESTVSLSGASKVNLCDVTDTICP